MRWCDAVDGWDLKCEELNIHVQVNYKADSQSQTLVYVQLVMEMMCKQKRVNQWYLQCKVSLLLAAWSMFWISGYPSGSGSGLCLFVTGLTFGVRSGILIGMCFGCGCWSCATSVNYKLLFLLKVWCIVFSMVVMLTKGLWKMFVAFGMASCTSSSCGYGCC